ncbi:ABC transporter permease [Anaerotignum propionicum]|uniref:ABC transporter permease n=1 Tax=Anaerotignum propionicum TaxID=28446 RepID=UPI00210DB9AB|nr:FtsX-like permease family protein [Anaerotignum propionicum]MCQ4936280.1 FtsX-like permease family protein [Anaerotignum propionicum]
MYRKLILNDMRKSKLITITITVFILLATMLTSMAAILSVSLFSSIEGMMENAKTPHFLQMHSGEIDLQQLSNFVNKQENIKDFQVTSFLNIEGSEIIIGENSLAGSIQDNGLSMQSQQFDFLLNLDGEIIKPGKGEIYVPIYYMKSGQVHMGDSIVIHGVHFTVAGFVRDSQMNASMISSKRFLVNQADFNLVRNFGKLEYLIEFRFADPSDASAFEALYLSEGMPSNGPPPITYSLFKMANAIDDGIMIAVLILVSILVIIVSFLCIRFTLLAKIEEDYREIGVLKAIGLRTHSIRQLYLAKYGALGGIACIGGFVLSLFAKEPFLANMRLYMGETGGSELGLLFGMLSVFIIFFVVILYVNGVLRRFKKISAAEAIRFGAPQEKSKVARGFRLSGIGVLSPNIFLGLKDVLIRKKLYVTMLLVLVISCFLIIVPQNIYNTISQRNFMTYMGIGECDMRMDIQQKDNIGIRTEEIASFMAKDSEIEAYTVLTSYMFDMPKADGTLGKLKVELGDHSIFPIKYSSGRAPKNESEIAISRFVADDLNIGINDSITLIVDGREKALTICGIYSDITNGGKTAKSIFQTKEGKILWSIIPVRLHGGVAASEKVAVYKEQFSYAKVADIDEYVKQSFGGIIDAVQKVSYAAIAIAIMLIMLVTVLFMKMLLTKERYSIAVMKSLGFKTSEIRIQYLARAYAVLILGILIGTILANTLGELLGAGLIASFGASSFRFVINPVYAYLFSPILMAASVGIATRLGISGISSFKIPDYIKE